MYTYTCSVLLCCVAHAGAYHGSASKGWAQGIDTDAVLVHEATTATQVDNASLGGSVNCERGGVYNNTPFHQSMLDMPRFSL